LWRRVVDEHVISEVLGRIHDCIGPLSRGTALCSLVLMTSSWRLSSRQNVPSFRLRRTRASPWSLPWWSVTVREGDP
jgi:hypothetical protein